MSQFNFHFRLDSKLISRRPGLGAIYVIISYIVFIFPGGLVWVQYMLKYYMLYLYFQAAWFGCNICYYIIYCIYISRQPGLGAIYVIILYIVFIFSGGLVWVQPSTGERRTVWGAHRCLQVSFVLFYELIVADMKSTYF